jgi:hypothetical protein
MKPVFFLFLLSASVCLAEEATLPSNTVMRTENSLVILKAGTVVQIVKRNNNTIAVKANGKAGLIPASVLDDADDPPPAPAPVVHAPAPAPAPVAAAAAPPDSTPPAPRKAQTMYGKAVEKARENADSHEKNLVDPADEVLGGK